MEHFAKSSHDWRQAGFQQEPSKGYQVSSTWVNMLWHLQLNRVEAQACHSPCSSSISHCFFRWFTWRRWHSCSMWGWQNMSFLLPEVQGTIKIQGSCQGRSRGKSGKNIYLQSWFSEFSRERVWIQTYVTPRNLWERSSKLRMSNL